jgi:hypothetical protein
MAWMPEPEPGPVPTVVKILRKGALNQPLSVRYLHAQFERACTRDSVHDGPSDLLRDIVVSHCLGLFKPPPDTIDVDARIVLLKKTPLELFNEHLRGVRSMVLHRVLTTFLSGVSNSVSTTLRFAISRGSLAMTTPLPALAYNGIFSRVLSIKRKPVLECSFGMSGSEMSPDGYLALASVTRGATAKRAKITATTKLSEPDLAALKKQCGSYPISALVPLDRHEFLAQSKFPEKVVHLCLGCNSWRPPVPVSRKRGVVVDLWRPGVLKCGGCGSSSIKTHVLNGRMLVTADPWRLCSECGEPCRYSALFHRGIFMVCSECNRKPKTPPCVVCGSSAMCSTLVSTATSYKLVGLCRTHNVTGDEVPVAISAPGLVEYIKARDRSRRK